MSDKPRFDPSKPFEAGPASGSSDKPKFDPSQPFDRTETRGFGGIDGQHGASGTWEIPDPGFLQDMGTKLNQGLAKKGSDELVGLLARGRFRPDPGRYLKLPDGTVVPARTPEEAQIAFREGERQRQIAADQHWPKLGFLADTTGEVLGDVALAGSKMAQPLYQLATGGLRGYLSSNSDNAADKAGSTALGAALGYGIAKAPAALKSASETPLGQAIANSRAGQMMGAASDYVGDLFTGAGDKLQDLAGFLKINSLHPGRPIAEDLAGLPGGVNEAGKTLLRKGLGGATKKATAEQIAGAYQEAAGNIGASAAALDATGASAPGLSEIASRALWRDAAPMTGRPLSRATGQKLGDILAEYQNIYDEQPKTFIEALKLRRELDDAIYKNSEFGAHPELSDLAESLRPFRADVNAAIQQQAEAASPELAAQFRNANLETRQLGLARRAADQLAGRGAGNHIVSLKDLMAASLPVGGLAAGAAFGHGAGGLSAGLASWLLGKYGAQAGARTLFELGGGLQAAPRLAQLLGTGLVDASGYSAPFASPLTSRINPALLELLQQPTATLPAPALADRRNQ